MGSCIELFTRLQSQFICAWLFKMVPINTVFIVTICPTDVVLSFWHHFQFKSGILSGFSLSLLLQPKFSYSGSCPMYFSAGKYIFNITYMFHSCFSSLSWPNFYLIAFHTNYSIIAYVFRIKRSCCLIFNQYPITFF